MTFRTRDLSVALEMAMRHMTSTDYRPEPVTSVHIYFVDVPMDGNGQPREYVLGEEPADWTIRCTLHRTRRYEFAYKSEVNP